MKKATLALLLIVATLTLMAQTRQCKGKVYDKKLKDSVQCRTPSSFVKNGYCHHHNPETPRCGATKSSDGMPCRKAVQKKGDRCPDHPMKMA